MSKRPVDSRTDLQEALAAQIEGKDLAAIGRTLDSLPAAITAHATSVDAARELLTDCLVQVTTCVKELGGKPRARLTASATTARLAQRSRIDDLLTEFLAIVNELDPALFRAQAARRYSDRRLMRRLIGGGRESVKSTPFLSYAMTFCRARFGS